MSIEDPKKKPNFPLIVALAATVMLAFFVVALIFLHTDHRVEPKAQPRTHDSALRIRAPYDVA